MLALVMLNRMYISKSINRMNFRRATRKRTSSTGKENLNDETSIYCRTCLSTKGLVPIFSNKSENQKRTVELKSVTGLEIKLNDGLSQKICPKCTKVINTVLEFRRTSRRSEKALISMLDTVAKPKKMKLRDVKPMLKVEAEENYGNDFDMGIDFQNEDDDGEYLQQEMKPFMKSKLSKSKCPAVPNASSYKCALCDKQFKMKATYKAHIRFHTNFCVCEICGKRCRNNNQLQEHKRARHGLGRIHKCAYCEYSSATKEALTIHERRHTGERPYICDHCGAAFHRRSNLVQHIAIHLPEKNFQCDLCPKRLKSKKFLQIHKHNAHTGKRYGYLCGICAHRFEKPNKVRAHARRVHGVPDDQQGPVHRVQL